MLARRFTPLNYEARSTVPGRRPHGALRRTIAHEDIPAGRTRRTRHEQTLAAYRDELGGARDRLPRPHGPQHRARRRGCHRRQPQDGLSRAVATRRPAARMQQLASRRDRGGEASQKLIGRTSPRGRSAQSREGQEPAPWPPGSSVGARGGGVPIRGAGGARLSPFVGRDDALATLVRAWAQVRSGRGRPSSSSADAGSASRGCLLEFRRHCRRGDLDRGDCISFGQSISVLPIVQMLKPELRHRRSRPPRRRSSPRSCAASRSSATKPPHRRTFDIWLSVDPGDRHRSLSPPAARADVAPSRG